MSNVLHITNGDGAANIIEASTVQGEVLPWRDPMHHGPCPSTNSLDELSRIRIDYLSGDVDCQSGLLCPSNPGDANNHGLVQQSNEQHGFSERDATLASSNKYEEVVLWFEHDLLDQLQLLQILNWFSQFGKSNLRLSLICIDQFAGVPQFRGIGQLSAVQMASLYPHRTPVTHAHFDIATKYWKAFCHSNPNTLLELCRSSESPDPNLPLLQPALMRHLQEFPWVSDGLTRTERQILQLFEAGIESPVKVFIANMDLESCLFIGDSRSYRHMLELCQADQPLLGCAGGVDFQHPEDSNCSFEQFRAQVLIVTDLGREVLAANASVLHTMHRDSWLGGVHLHTEQGLWCWDNEQSQLINSTGLQG